MPTIPRVPIALLLAVLGLVGVLVICATVLAWNGTPVPAWYETLATVGVGGVLGAYQPNPPPKP